MCFGWVWNTFYLFAHGNRNHMCIIFGSYVFFVKITLIHFQNLWMFVSWKSTCKTLCASRWIVHIIFWSLVLKSMKHIKLNELPRTSIRISTPLKLPKWRFNSKINICLFVPTLKKQFWKTTQNRKLDTICNTHMNNLLLNWIVNRQLFKLDYWSKDVVSSWKSL
jgi:hypothetical protein